MDVKGCLFLEVCCAAEVYGVCFFHSYPDPVLQKSTPAPGVTPD